MKTTKMCWKNATTFRSKINRRLIQLSVILLFSIGSMSFLNAQNFSCGTDFTYTNSGGLTVDFKGSAIGEVSYYAWDFGDSTFVQGDIFISHTYATDGVYNVCLIGYDSLWNYCMGSQTSCHSVTVGAPDTTCTATASFWPLPDGMTVFTQNNSYGNFDSQFWEFGDGSTSEEFKPYHTYTTQDTFTICLTVWNSNDTSCHNTQCQYVYPYASDPCSNLYPYYYNYGDSAMGMYFYNNTQGGVDSQVWEFGDGTTSTEANPYHVYANYGWYNVCLTVTKDTCTKSWCSMINIPDPSGCEAKFEYYQGNTSTEVYFYNQSFGNFTQTQWNFGDGVISDEYNPTHKFPYPGLFKVCLSVWNDSTGCENQYCMDVYIENQSNCFPEFSQKPDSSNMMGFNFYNFSGGNYTNLMWDFGDGTSSTDMNPFHEYASFGEYVACLTIWDSSGNCQNQSCHSIFIMDPNGCYAGFEFKQAETGLGVDFFNVSRGNFDSHYWTFGDGDSSIESNPMHTYAMEGDYEVCLTIYNSATQCSDTYCTWVYVYNMTSGCKAYFEHWYDSTGTGVNFWNASSGDFTEFYWTFGDGSSSIDMHPHHAYNAPGMYTVCLKVGNNMSGCMDEYCYTVYINAQSTCKAYFTNGYTSDLGAQFENLSSGDYTGMMWDFGDGMSSDLKNPTHNYAMEGNYLVCLKLWNDTQTCYDNYCSWVYVFDQNACNAYFSFYLDSTGRNVHFENWSNKDGNRYWNFGDGDTSSDKSPVHTYSMDGSYEVCLNIWEDSCSDTYCSTLYIYDQNRCKAYFSSWSDSTGLGINFADYSSGEHNHVKWSFGDGTFSEEMNPHHVYANKGEYEVCMEIWNDNSNCFDKYCSMIYVHDPASPCNAYFGYYLGEEGLTVNFMNSSSGYNNSWTNNMTWDFGDGTTSSEYSPMHTFANEGAYKVCLSVINDSTGCSDTFCTEVFVKAKPECEVYFNYQQPDSGLGIYFGNNSWGNYTNWLWDFGDGSTSSEPWPFHDYSTEGWYKVCLQIWSDSGNCQQTICNSVYVFDMASLNSFYGYTTSDTTGVTINFMNWSSGQPSNILWDFGDGTTSTEASPRHEYAQYGMYNVCLTVTDSLGNTDTYCDSLGFFPVNRPAEFVNSVEAIKIYPNPANPKTTINYLLAKSTKVEINIYDMFSRKIHTLVNANLTAGMHEYQWDATKLNAGLYFIEVKTGHSRNLYKIALVK